MKPKQTQQVVIPKGVLQANEAAVIEIPRRYHKNPIVVVKKRLGEISDIRAAKHFVSTDTDPQPLYPAPYSMVVPVNNSRQTNSKRRTSDNSFLFAHSPPPQPPSPQFPLPPPQMPSYYPTPVYYGPPPPINYQEMYQPACYYPQVNITDEQYHTPQNLARREDYEKKSIKTSLEEFQRARRNFLEKSKSVPAKASQISFSSTDS